MVKAPGERGRQGGRKRRIDFPLNILGGEEGEEVIRKEGTAG